MCAFPVKVCYNQTVYNENPSDTDHPMHTYPLNLINLATRKAIVIGGGAVALRKVEGLLEGGAAVTVISPVLADGLVALRAASRISVVPRPYQDGDLADAWLVVAATDDAAVNQAVFAEAERRGCLVNVVDDPEHSNFIVPAVVRRGEVTVAISTGGSSPALARRLRERLAELIGPEYGDLAALLAELRPALLARFPAGKPRLDAALRLVDSDLLTVLKEQGMAVGRTHAEALLETPSQSPQSGIEASAGHPHDPEKPAKASTPGLVYLVGAGPGDPGLITVRGLACLAAADVVVFDRLIPPALLDGAPQAERIDVGKQPGHHPVPQEQINAILVEQAQLGKTVVRLKGGDPFVFGRGGEEAEALAAAGVPFEVVPGVTSAIAAAAYAGIPVTHRDAARSFAVITGHRKDDGEEADYDWAAAAGADTLVFLMGVGNLPVIVDHLLAAGRSPATPAAIVARGTWPQQRTVTGTLRDIVGQANAADIRPPAALIVGEVVRLRERLRWFDRPDRRPLLGLRVLNTRPAHEAAAFAGRLAGLGAEAITLPAIRIAACADSAAMEAVIHELAAGGRAGPAYDWLIFTSANAVAAFLERLFALGAPDAPGRRYDARSLAGVRLAAIGPVTAAALRNYGLAADLVSEGAPGKRLAAAMPDIAGQRLLLPRSDQAMPELPAALAAHGAHVTEVVAYSVVPAQPDLDALAVLQRDGVDVAAFFSPSALRGLAAMLGEQPAAEAQIQDAENNVNAASDANDSEDATIRFHPRSSASDYRVKTLADALGEAAIACVGPTTAAAAQAMGLRVDIVPEQATAEGLINALIKWRGYVQNQL